MEGYDSVSCCEFEVLNSSDKAPQNPTENVAFNKPAVASSVEGGTSFYTEVKRLMVILREHHAGHLM